MIERAKYKIRKIDAYWVVSIRSTEEYFEIGFFPSWSRAIGWIQP